MEQRVAGRQRSLTRPLAGVTDAVIAAANAAGSGCDVIRGLDPRINRSSWEAFFKRRWIAGSADKFRSAQNRLLRPATTAAGSSRAQPLRATIEIQQFRYLRPRRLIARR